MAPPSTSSRETHQNEISNMSVSIFDTEDGYDALSETEPDCPQSLSSAQITESDEQNVTHHEDDIFDSAKK